eukprot:Skav220426  [mRNA]  locus=scaffold639:762328:762823:+ [translate_table: standard]
MSRTLRPRGYAFAQSVKLAVFETIVDASIEKAQQLVRGDQRSAKPIPEALAQYGTFDMDEKLVKMFPGAANYDERRLTQQLAGQ